MPQDPKKSKWDKYVVGKWEKYAVQDTVEAQPQPEQPTQERPLYRRINEAAIAPLRTMGQGIQQVGRGNYPAGVANFMAGTMQAPFAPLGVATELVGEIPVVGPTMKEGLQGLASIPPALLRLISGGIESGLGAAGYTPETERQLLGQTPGQYRDTRQAMGNLSDVASGYVVPEAVARTGVAYANRPVSPPKVNPKLVQKGNVALERALPTTSKELTRPTDRARMAPYLAQEQRLAPVKKGNISKGGSDPSVIRQLAEEKFPKIKKRIWEDQQEFIDRNADVPLVGGVEKVANSIESLRNIYTKNVDLLADQSILTEAAKFREMGTITVAQASEMLRSINADLQKFYKMGGESQAAAINAAKPIAEMERAARALRDGVAETLKRRGENAGFYKKLHDDYGAAIRLESAAERNVTKAETPLPPMFTERVSQMYPSRPGVMREVGEHTLGRFFTPDKLAARALNRYAKSGIKPENAPFPPEQPPIRGLLPPAPIRLPQGLEETGAKVTMGQYARPDWKQLPERTATLLRQTTEGELRVSTGKIGELFGAHARNDIIKILGGPDKMTRFGPLRMVSDKDLVTLAKEAGFYGNADIREAPVSRGGSMNVRGLANQEQIRRGKK